jgi:molybdate transport system substrate-binding protein
VRLLTLICLLWSSLAACEEALVAVATNFLGTARILEAEFEQSGEHNVTLTAGATGQLYSQIRNGAPFDVFLAADQARPELLEASGVGVSGSRFTYASGRLAVWSANRARIKASLEETLHQTDIRAIAIANPRLAPYGQAALETLASLQVQDDVEDLLVLGENIGQAFALVATANADLGLVALSQVRSFAADSNTTYTEIDPVHHEPILQDAIMLRHGADNLAAGAFLSFLKSHKAAGVIADSGYGVSRDD